MSIRAIINLRILASVILILIFSAIIAIWQARASVEQEVRSSINLAVQMIDFGFAQQSTSSDENDVWLDKVATMKPVRHLHISIEDHNRALHERVSAALDDDEESAPQWFTRAVMADFFTHNHQIQVADGSTKTIAITANPMDEISEAWGETKAFFWSIVLMLSIIFCTVNLVFNSMLKAVKEILSGLRQVESGNFDYVLPQFKISEFDDIAKEVNGMSVALKTAQQSNQALARHTMQIQETERQTMSRELHDEMGQSLTAIKAMAVTCQQPDADVKAVSRAIVDICNHLAVVVRSMMRTLHPLSLTELGLGATLSELVREWQRRVPELEFNLNYDEALESLSHEVTIHVYRIVQECLTNVIRHANATEVAILVVKRGNKVWLTVSDNGQGGQLTPSGFGLLGMRERAENLGGQFKLESLPNNGVNVVVKLPYWEDNNE
ncbi:sensor histidine kinase [Psychrobium sp. 1_MG-2023]|uniref:sensor histidine kinase n=1 Tax=Psychrobium sp. 1_MG-2023 TaxID=3062624 RepID=UPI000C328FE0|nr:sensor histidine kinase [Psychrobium sp. 1_MG-2023]MDP2561777.1 sensor histidine kinase [Psychrobium sp. 1_MG-2023]PKF59739.1 sensor histidine kinase [Alteromonadales bacterium alter-6D02]